MKIIDLNQIPLDTYVRKTIHFEIGETNAIQKWSGKDELSGYLLVGLKTRRASSGARALEDKALINDDVLDSTYLSIMNGEMTVCSNTPLAEIADASKENPQFGLLVPISDFRFATSGLKVSNKAAIVEGEYVELTFILIPKQ